ncbi:MAG: hypothetical protein PHY77_02940 [Desulfotomaculaceae bacterium]|nr:hypothetical protein [Desulfotomaculaceae bacterium]
MRKVLIIALLLCLSLSAGCSALQQPAPAPEPTPSSVIPETSKLGFSPIDLNKAPDVIKNIASDISKREATTWVQVNDINYILASAGENIKYKIEITDIIQKVPAQDFIWLEVKAKYVSAKDAGDKSGPVTAVSLNPPNRTINGAGFEIVRAEAAAPAPAPAAQIPAPPAQTPKTTPAAPAPAPAPTTGQDKTIKEQGKTTTDQTKKTQPSEINGENSKTDN